MNASVRSLQPLHGHCMVIHAIIFSAELANQIIQLTLISEMALHGVWLVSTDQLLCNDGKGIHVTSRRPKSFSSGNYFSKKLWSRPKQGCTWNMFIRITIKNAIIHIHNFLNKIGLIFVVHNKLNTFSWYLKEHE